MQLESSETILICCAGLGMGNASRVVAVMESMHELGQQTGENLRFEIASWGAGYKFLQQYRSNGGGVEFNLTALEDYSAQSFYKLPALYLKNSRRLKALVKKTKPALIVLDSDYHFSAYANKPCPLISVGQASDVVKRARKNPQFIKTWREHLNFILRERLDAYLQWFFSDLVLVPCFEPGESRRRNQKRIPLIVRKEFLISATRPEGMVSAGLLLSGSELEKKPFVDFASKHGWQVLTPGSSGQTVLSNAGQIDSFDFVFTQGGLSSISECIARARFIVAFPIHGHPEQILNAVEVERLGLGVLASTAELGDFPRLLERIRQSESEKRMFVRPSCNGATVAARILLNLRNSTNVQVRAKYVGLRPSPPNSGAAAL